MKNFGRALPLPELYTEKYSRLQPIEILETMLSSFRFTQSAVSENRCFSAKKELKTAVIMLYKNNNRIILLIFIYPRRNVRKLHQRLPRWLFRP